MKQDICHIVGAGEFDAQSFCPGPGDFVIAADAGYRSLMERNLTPHLVVGDFDSLGKIPEGDQVIRLPVEKDDTDMMAALRLGVERGFREFRLWGGTGGRMDHTLANLQSLVWLSQRGCRGRLMDRNWTAFAVTDGTLRFGAAHRGTVSVFCVGDRAAGVWLRGLKYPLEDAVLTCDFPLGVSNAFTGVESSITVGQGTLLVIEIKG